MATLGLWKANCNNKNSTQEVSHSSENFARPPRHNRGPFLSKSPVGLYDGEVGKNHEE